MSDILEDWFDNENENTDSVETDEIIVDRSKFFDENGVDIYKKKSSEKTVEERIKTSRSLKIKYNKWNQVDFTEDAPQEKIVIDSNFTGGVSSYEDLEFERKFHELIKNSKYKSLLFNLDTEKVAINYQIINDILLYTYARMKKEYSLSKVFVLVCEYCKINIQTMWKKLSSYIQKRILEELTEYSPLAKSELYADNQLF
jgi:hypothetical protein